MTFDPVSWGLGWVLTRVTSRVADWLRKPSLSKDLRAEVAVWTRALPTDASVNPDALFPSVLSDEEAVDRPLLLRLRQDLRANNIPRVELWNAAFLEHWRYIRRELGANAQPFFLLPEHDVTPHLNDLAKRIFSVCCGQDPLFRPTLISYQQEILGLQDSIADQLAELNKRVGLSPAPTSPNDWLPLETYAVVFPPSVGVDKAWEFICRLLVLALHDAFALSRNVQFISAVQSRPIEYDGGQLNSFELLSQQSEFLAAARRRTKAVLDGGGDKGAALTQDDALDALRTDGWKFEVAIPLGAFYRPVLFVYDARNRAITITDRSNADPPGESCASAMLTTSDQIEFMCQLLSQKLAVINFDETANNPAAFRFLVSVAAEKGFDFARIRVHKRNCEKWDYLLSPL